uniref:ShKT domain-containing protein n=1 Tax=Acrobeloides nanus TaxID=290746 RepID=A0A914CXK9_9BILA
MANCYQYSTLCNATLYQSIMNATCACTCGLCTNTTTTNACTGLAAGANVGPCINNACQTGATCNTTTQLCICLTAGR